MRFSVKRCAVMIAVATLLGCKGSKPADEGSKPGDHVQTVRGAIIPDETTPIGQKWRALLNAGINLGEATTVELLTPGGAARYQRFPVAVIVYTNDYGAVYMPPAIFDKWLSLQTLPDASGTPVFSLFGVPVRDYTATPGYSSATFEGGMIFTQPGSARVVYGGIYSKYSEMADALGPPVTEEATPTAPLGARYQVFGSGEIYWHPDRGAFAILAGPILSKWYEYGRTEIGMPIADTGPIKAADGTTTIGQVGRFVQGNIYLNAATGVAHVLENGLQWEYERHGGPTGWLGFPTSSTAFTSSALRRFNDMEHGVLLWWFDAATQKTAAIGNLEFFLRRVTAHGNDCLLCGAQDLYYRVQVIKQISGGVDEMVVNDRKPNSGDFDADTHEHNGVLGPLMVANSALSIHARVKIYDRDSCPSDLECEDEHVGTPSFTFNVDNGWGLVDGNGDHTSGGRTNFSIRRSHPFDEKDFRGQKYWSFQNFVTDDLSYTQYSDTFADVTPGEAAYFNQFNAMYYELFYRNVAAGNCLGMNIESVYAAYGRSSEGMPIHDSFADTQGGSQLDPNNATHWPLYREINVKQGYQLGLESILWRVGKFLTFDTHNPSGVFNESQASFNANDFPLITLEDDFLGRQRPLAAAVPVGDRPRLPPTAPGCVRAHLRRRSELPHRRDPACRRREQDAPVQRCRGRRQ